MVTLRKGEPLYDAVFGGSSLPDFVAKGPTYQQIHASFDSNPAIREQLTKADTMRADQAHDVRGSLQWAMQTLAVATQADISPNFPSVLIPAMRSIIMSEDVGLSLNDAGVARVFDVAQNAASGNVVGTAGAVLGLGMAAVGVAVPVVGLVAAAIVGLVTGIVSIFDKREKDKVLSDKAYRARLYRSFPPLQSSDSSTDGAIINKSVLPTLQGRDWSSIYTPQFTGKEWVGLERQGGFAFAPGSSSPGDDDPVFGALDVFTPSGGLGIIPGTNQMTSIVQVNLVLDPDAAGGEAWKSFLKGGADPRGIGSDGIYGWTRVHDTGMYFPATARLAGSMWSMALAKGSPFKYRINAKALHDFWREWAEGGIRYIRETCYPWWPKHSDGSGKIAVSKKTNFEGFCGTSIFNSVGAWTGVVDPKKSTTLKQVYKPLTPPDGITGPELVAATRGYGMVGGPVSSTYSGGFLPILDPDNWPDQFMGTIYDRRINIRATLNNLQAQQRYDLQHTLVCASVSVKDAAFKGDTKLMDLLLSMRAKLLTSEDRFYVDLADVTDDEPGLKNGGKNEASWKKQLAASGVTTDPKTQRGPIRLAPSNEPPPPEPPFHGTVPNPWDPKAKGGSIKPSGGGGLALGLGAVGLTGAALIAAYKFRNKKRRSFSAGKLK
jgi:hypothetical protein